MRTAIWLLLLVCVASADECPPDRPNRRFVMQYPMTMSCTMVYCPPRLVCEPGFERCEYTKVDCNSCTPAPVHTTICLTDDELKSAEGYQR